MGQQQFNQGQREADALLAKRLVKGIAFGMHGARVLVRQGYPLTARKFRQTVRRQVGELRALRALSTNEGGR